MPQHETINIRPESGILAVLSHLNYKPWFALAEFVDNSVQSYVNERRRLEALGGQSTALEVVIKLDQAANRITIRDNAGGIALKDYARAFKAAELPLDRTGLSEFGVGMKIAACWFCKKWSVRTSAIGEAVERTVVFDVDEIQRTDAESLNVLVTPAAINAHYTELTLETLNHGVPQKRTLSKIRDHLRDIYRCFTRDGFLKLYLDTDYFGEELLVYPEREFLTASPYGSNHEPIDTSLVTWWKEIDFEFGETFRAHGHAGILDVMDSRGAPFALFRRRRLILGGDDEPFRPTEVFGSPGSFVYKRVFGELHLEGVGVAGTKDGFRWEGHEEDFFKKLREQLDAEPMSLLKQADNYRSRPKPNTTEANEIKSAAKDAANSVVAALTKTSDELTKLSQDNAVQFEPDELTPTPEFAVFERVFNITVGSHEWTIRIEYVNDSARGQLIELAGHPEYDNRRRLSYRLNLAHPYVQSFVGAGYENLEMVSFLAAAISLAERTTQAAGEDNQAARMRTSISDILKAMTHSRS